MRGKGTRSGRARGWRVLIAALAIPICLRAQTVEIVTAPLYVAGDGSKDGGTPCAIFAQLTGGEPNATYYVKAYLAEHPGSARTWDPATGAWIRSGQAWEEQRQVTTDTDGNWAGWIACYFYESTVGSPKTLRISMRKVGTETNLTGELAGLTSLSMATGGNGAWVHGTCSGINAGWAILAKDAAGNILGSYIVEDNGIAEKPTPYDNNDGYFRLAVPANAAIATLETRSPSNTLVRSQSGNWHAGDAGTDVDLDAQEDASLPVQLVSLDASWQQDGSVEVRWVTGAEAGVRGFLVCRSTDGLPSPQQRVSQEVQARGTGAQGCTYTWCDENPPEAGDIWYAVYAREESGELTLLGSVVVVRGHPRSGNLPEEFEFAVPYPNPFGSAVGFPATQLAWKAGTTDDGAAELCVYDLLGRLVRRVAVPTTGSWSWDGRDELGRLAPAGSYVVVLRAGGRSASQRVFLLR